MATINLTIEEAIEHLRKHFQLNQEDEINICGEVVVQPDENMKSESSTVDMIGADWTRNTPWSICFASNGKVDVQTHGYRHLYDMHFDDVDWETVEYWRFAKHEE